MGVIRPFSRLPFLLSLRDERFAFTPIPGPSPIKGEGSGV